VTLDLTTHVPPNNSHKKSKVPKTGRGSNKSLANAPGKPHLAAHDHDLYSPAPTPVFSQDGATSPQPHQQTQQPPLRRQMQIVDLHEHNPLISLDNALYSCRWATDVGTSLFFTPPLSDVDPDHAPIRSTPSFDLLGTTCARLIAVPATMTPRAAPVATKKARPHEPDSLSYATNQGDIVRQSESQGINIELPSTASASRVSQARFLERLSAIKAQRGDQDAVPVTNIKIYRPPEGWEAERDAYIARETSMNEKNRLEADLRAEKLLSRANKAHRDASHARDVEANAAASDAVDFTEHDLDSPDPDPDRVGLASQIFRKRKARGGPRGGAPSGKRLRQSLGLPESRKDKRVPGRPRQIRLDSELVEESGELAAASASPDPRLESAEPSAGAGASEESAEPVQ